MVAGQADFRERYERAVLTDPGYRHTAKRWEDHMKAYPELDSVSRDNCLEFVRCYQSKEAKNVNAD